MYWHFVKALHIIAMTAWFAGLFYLPRLYVYHAMSEDAISQARFKIMERKLYFFIMTPSALCTVFLGALLYTHHFSLYLHAPWMYLKLFFVALLLGFHGYCGYCYRLFKRDRNPYGHRYYRILNEIPTALLCLIVIMIVVMPTF